MLYILVIIFTIKNVYPSTQTMDQHISSFVPDCVKDKTQCLKEKLWSLFYQKNDIEGCKQISLPLAEEGVAIAQFFMGKILFEQGRITEGVKYYELAIQQDHRGALDNMGLYYTDSNNPVLHNKAIEYFKKSINFGNLNARNNLASLYIKLKQYNNAEKHLLKAFEDGVLIASLNLSILYLREDNPVKDNIKGIMYIMIPKMIIEINHDFFPHASLVVRYHIDSIYPELEKKIPVRDIAIGIRKAKEWILNNPKEFLTAASLEKNSL